MCKEYGPTLQDAHQARLALSEISLVVPRGPATHKDKGIRQVTACPGCAPEKGHDRKGGCRAGGGKLQGSKGNIAPHPCQQVSECHFMDSFSSGQWKETWTFQNRLVPFFRCLELRGSSVLQRGNHIWAAENLQHLSSLPSFLCRVDADLRSLLHPAKSPTPQLCAHIHPLQRVCSAAPRHGSMALEKDREEEATCLLLR